MRFLGLFIFTIILNAGIIDLGTNGHLYDIEEKDMYEVIKERFRDLNKSYVISTLNKSIEAKKKIDFNIPYCQEERTYKRQIIIEAKKDVVFQGKVIVKKGTKINVLSRVFINGNIIFCDKQTLNMVIPFLTEENNRIYITRGNVEKLYKEIENDKEKILFFKPANMFLLKKLKIRCIPTLIEQKGKYLIYKEIKVEE